MAVFASVGELQSLLPERAVKAARRAGQSGYHETPVAIPVRRIGEDGHPVYGRREIRGGLQDVDITGGANKFKLQSVYTG
jgi:hypothetical protein